MRSSERPDPTQHGPLVIGTRLAAIVEAQAKEVPVVPARLDGETVSLRIAVEPTARDGRPDVQRTEARVDIPARLRQNLLPFGVGLEGEAVNPANQRPQ